ncbi:hypothetical protein D3C85_1499030 [compost metagenome]
MVTGWNTLGIAAEARTAVPVSPLFSTTRAPLSRSVTTAPKRRDSCSIFLPSTCWLTIAASFSPFRKPEVEKVKSRRSLSLMRSAR